jgi:hypothetical protein
MRCSSGRSSRTWGSARLSSRRNTRPVQASRASRIDQQRTIWCWLSEDAIRPRHHRSWIFPRYPDLAEKAGRILDLYRASGKAAG